MTIVLKGNWKKGFAYDVHTISSTYLGADEYGHEQWETTRSEMGQLIYDLKYKQNTSVVSSIVDLLLKMDGIEIIDQVDCIVPIPATNPNRTAQPVLEIVCELEKYVDIPVMYDLLTMERGGPELKNVFDPSRRQELLREKLILSDKHNISNQNILLIDDLYRSGATLKEATELLYDAGVQNVYVIAMTRTRRIR